MACAHLGAASLALFTSSREDLFSATRMQALASLCVRTGAIGCFTRRWLPSLTQYVVVVHLYSAIGLGSRGKATGDEGGKVPPVAASVPSYPEAGLRNLAQKAERACRSTTLRDLPPRQVPEGCGSIPPS